MMLWVAHFEMSLRYAGHRSSDAVAPTITEETSVLTRQSRLSRDPNAQMVMYAKALYDMLLSEQQHQDDARAKLYVSMIKEDLHILDGLPRWLPHDKNPADGLTKFEGAHMVPLMDLLRTNQLRIIQEKDELRSREQVREQKGYNPRPRVGASKGRPIGIGTFES